MRLILVLPYCSKDAAILAKNLAWMGELQSKYLNPCILFADSEVPPDTKQEINATAKSLFSYAETCIVRMPADKQNWIDGSNRMFSAAARQIAETSKEPWLWFEPDATPLKIGWLNSIEKEYSLSPKRFMGSLIPSNGQENMPPVHLAGCAVYDQYAYGGMNQFTEGKVAFDIAAAGYTVPRATNCRLMQHFWGKVGLPPVFVERTVDGGPENHVSVGMIQRDAVMFHRCKDGSLIDVLRKQRNKPLQNEGQSESLPRPKTNPQK